MDHFEVEANALLTQMALVSYGGVARFGGRRGESEHVGPSGESLPMHEDWAAIFDAVGGEDARAALLEEARAEYESWVRRPLAPTTTETMEEIRARIVAGGWGESAELCAISMCCTTSTVREARLEALRHPDTGYGLPERKGDLFEWAAALEHVGLSVRQIAQITGVAKSTLYDRLSRR